MCPQKIIFFSSGDWPPATGDCSTAPDGLPIGFFCFALPAGIPAASPCPNAAGQIAATITTAAKTTMTRFMIAFLCVPLCPLW
jgi:hypothetical protein